MPSHFEADENPCATYFDVHKGYRVLTHSHVYCVSAMVISTKVMCFVQKTGIMWPWVITYAEPF